MPNLTSKKTKTINSSSLIKNQISNILQPVNGTISLNVQNKNTISTQSASSQSYYIPLLEKITGEQSINVKKPLSFNATTNTLSVPNLIISNLPTYNVDASNSSDLVNKSYVDTYLDNIYVNQYVNVNLAGGYRWYCEDWISINKRNWDLSVNFLDYSIPATEFITINNTTAYPYYNFNNDHIGVLRILSWNNGGGRISISTVSSRVMYNTSKLKSLRFISTISNGTGALMFMGLSTQTDKNVFALPEYTPLDINNAAVKNIGFFLSSAYTYYPVVSNGYLDNPYPYPKLFPNINTFEWVLLELTIQSKTITFSAKNLTTNTTYNTYSTTISNDFDAYIYMQHQSGSGIPPWHPTFIPRFLCIDYIDWVISS